MSDTKVHEPWIRARLESAAHKCEVIVLELRTVATGKLHTLNLKHQTPDPKAEGWGAPKPKAEEWVDRKVDIRLHGKGNSNSHGARPVY